MLDQYITSIRAVIPRKIAHKTTTTTETAHNWKTPLKEGGSVSPETIDAVRPGRVA